MRVEFGPTVYLQMNSNSHSYTATCRYISFRDSDGKRVRKRHTQLAERAGGNRGKDNPLARENLDSPCKEHLYHGRNYCLYRDE